MGRAQRRRFTLIELLVVVSIIAILAAMLLPVLSKTRRQAKMTLCMNNLRELGMMLNMYSGDNDGYYPRRKVGESQLGPRHALFFKASGMPAVDDRSTYDGYIDLDITMDCPLSPVGSCASRYDTVTTEIWSSYAMFYGSRYETAQPKSAMLRVGDRPLYNGKTFDILAGDFDRRDKVGTFNQGAHPDGQVMDFFSCIYKGQYVMGLYWNTNNPGTIRGPIDRSFLRDDGSTFIMKRIYQTDSRTTLISDQPGRSTAQANASQYLPQIQ